MTSARLRAGVLPVAALLIVACAGGPGTPTAGPTTPASAVNTAPPTPQPITLNLLAAASLKGVLDKATTAYEASHPGITILVSTDSSAALEAQIEQGAPADVFLSADTTSAQKLVDGGFGSGAPVVFARNLLTIIVPPGNPGSIAGPVDLGRKGVRVIAAGPEVPITKYATQLIQKVATTTTDPAAFQAAYAANIVTNAENVKAIVAQIELGQGDAAIVYVTDANASTKVETVTVPADLNVAASYAGVVVKASANTAAAQAFLDWFAGPDGQAILAGLGFLPPGS